MNDMLKISAENVEKAFQIIDELNIKEIWEGLDSTCNLVGSVKTGLLMTHLDIDFHTYSTDFSIEKSFEAIGKISEHPKIKEITYKNLLDAEDMCLEWHLTYEEHVGRSWTIDIMHIKNESVYAGVIERVTEKISNVLTPKLKESILKIKWESTQRNEKIPGIEIYEAVIGNKITSYNDFVTWREGRKKRDISLWEPFI